VLEPEFVAVRHIARTDQRLLCGCSVISTRHVRFNERALVGREPFRQNAVQGRRVRVADDCHCAIAYRLTPELCQLDHVRSDAAARVAPKSNDATCCKRRRRCFDRPCRNLGIRAGLYLRIEAGPGTRAPHQRRAVTGDDPAPLEVARLSPLRDPLYLLIVRHRTDNGCPGDDVHYWCGFELRFRRE
jgi:hypothetical protein